MHNPPSTPSTPTPPEQADSEIRSIENEIVEIRTTFCQYMCDANLNYHKIIPVIERVLKEHPELLPMLLPVAQGIEFGSEIKERVVEGLQLLVSTKVAKDKHFLHSLGLLKTREKGDFREAVISADVREFMLAMHRYKSVREHPASQALINVEVAKSDRKFNRRLKGVLRQDPVTLEYRLGSKLRLFLLSRWLGEPSDPSWPPLCICSDPTIAKLAMIRGFQNDVTDKLVRKNWERLGLRKASTIECWGARTKKMFRDGRRVRTVVFDVNRNRA